MNDTVCAVLEAAEKLRSYDETGDGYMKHTVYNGAECGDYVRRDDVLELLIANRSAVEIPAKTEPSQVQMVHAWRDLDRRVLAEEITTAKAAELFVAEFGPFRAVSLPAPHSVLKRYRLVVEYGMATLEERPEGECVLFTDLRTAAPHSGTPPLNRTAENERRLRAADAEGMRPEVEAAIRREEAEWLERKLAIADDAGISAGVSVQCPECGGKHTASECKSD